MARTIIKGTVRLLKDGYFLEVSRTKDTVGLLSLGALLGPRRWKNKKVRITISEAR